jgi:GT2 family glycosyltransferase
MGKDPEVSVIVPTVGRPDLLYQLLESLEHQSFKNFEVIIVDQSTRIDPRVQDFVCAKHDRMRILHLRTPNLPYARNCGIREAKGRIILFIDDDEIAHPDLLQRHVDNHKKGVDGVGGQIIGGYEKKGFTDLIGCIRWDGKVIRNFGANICSSVEHLPGGNMSFSKEVFQKVGLFDTSYGGAVSEGEETDFCLRAKKAGFNLFFDARAKVEHKLSHKGGCRDEDFDRWVFWHAHNAMLFGMRHISGPGLIISLTKRMARFLIWAILKGSISIFFCGICGLIAGTRRFRKGISYDLPERDTCT